MLVHCRVLITIIEIEMSNTFYHVVSMESIKDVSNILEVVYIILVSDLPLRIKYLN